MRICWQFKNGKLGWLARDGSLAIMLRTPGRRIYWAWDRALGGWVLYEA